MTQIALYWQCLTAMLRLSSTRKRLARSCFGSWEKRKSLPDCRSAARNFSWRRQRLTLEHEGPPRRDSPRFAWSLCRRPCRGTAKGTGCRRGAAQSGDEDRFEMEGPEPIKRILQGAVVDPFGHMWLIGKILA